MCGVHLLYAEDSQFLDIQSVSQSVSAHMHVFVCYRVLEEDAWKVVGVHLLYAQDTQFLDIQSVSQSVSQKGGAHGIEV